MKRKAIELRDTADRPHTRVNFWDYYQTTAGEIEPTLFDLRNDPDEI